MKCKINYLENVEHSLKETEKKGSLKLDEGFEKIILHYLNYYDTCLVKLSDSLICFDLI